MFSLHETTKIRLGRAAFVALCVGPTCAVLAWCGFVGTPTYRRMHERAIAANTGCEVRLARVRSPRPGALQYEGLELSDRDTAQPLARLPLVEVASRGGSVVVTLPFPAIVNGGRLDAVVKLIGDLARGWPQARTLHFEAQNLTLHLRSGDQTFTDVFGQIDGDENRTQAKLTFRRAVAGNRAAEPCLLSLTHSRDAMATHSIRLTTGSTPLPMAAIAALLPGVERLGKTCHFAGRISASESSGAWHAELAGQLSGIDLDLLVSRQFPHKLTGLGDVRLKSAIVQAGRVESAVGSVTAGPGVISRSLVQSAETHLHIQAADQALKGRDNLIAYQKLCVGFEIGPQGMTLRGEVPQTRGAMLIDDRRVLALEPPLASQPVVDLVRTLVPNSEVHVPATRETAGLTGVLPIPSIVSAPGSEQPLPHARPVSVNPLRPEKKPIRR
ncbi:MAG: hypothetical protein WDZ48_06170 [Pirellulales bacterium]